MCSFRHQAEAKRSEFRLTTTRGLALLGSGCFCSGKAAAKTIYNQESELFSKVSVEIKEGGGSGAPSPFVLLRIAWVKIT